MSCDHLPVPPEYRFRPTKTELLCDHLAKKNRCKDSQIMSIIPVIDLCKHEPRELPGLAFTRQENLGRKLYFDFFFRFTRAESWYSQGKWYFFAPREYKYPNSTRSNRTTGEGSWKVTGKDRDIKAPGSEAVIGRKRILTFQKRGVPKSHKTGYVIHEYYHIQPHSDPPKQIGDFVVCCLKYKPVSDHDEDAPFCNRGSGSGSGSCSMVSNVANQAEENLASNEQFNGTDDEAETGGGWITEAEQHLAYKRDGLRTAIGNQNEFQGSQTDPCNLWTSVEGQADRSNSSHMIEERLDDPENMDSFFHPPGPPQLHQLHQSPMYTTNVQNDECRKRKYPFEDNDSSLTKKKNISTNDGDELVSNTTANSENQAADVILEGDSVICRLKNKSDKKDSLVSDEGEPDSAGVSNWKIQAAHKNDEPLLHQPQRLDDCCSSAVRSPASPELEAVLQLANGDDCNKLESPCGDNTSCLEDKNEVSTCDEDETMDGVFLQLCDLPEVSLDSFLRPIQPQDYRPSILQSSIYTKLGNVLDANRCFSECKNWQSAFKKKTSTNEVDIPVRHIMSNFENQATDSMILEVHRQTKENMESAFHPLQLEDLALQSMMYTKHGDALHNIECNELQSYCSDQIAQTPSIDSNLPNSLGRVYHGNSGVSSYDTNIEVAYGWEQHTSALAIENPPM